MIFVSRTWLMTITVLLGASLSGKSEGNLLAIGFAQNDLRLVNGFFGVLQLGQADAFGRLNVLAHDLGNLKGLLEALFHGLGHRHLNGDIHRGIHLGYFVLLGLVFLMAVLMFALTTIVLGSVSGRRLASGDLHGLRLLFIGELAKDGLG